MDVAYNTYDGISDQVYCNSHPVETEVLLYWANINLFAPEDYVFLVVWDAFWLATAGYCPDRKEAFETAYQFEFREEINPVTGQPIDVIAIGADQYFDWLSDQIYIVEAGCEGLLYPDWP